MSFRTTQNSDSGDVFLFFPYICVSVYLYYYYTNIFYSLPALGSLLKHFTAINIDCLFSESQWFIVAARIYNVLRKVKDTERPPSALCILYIVHRHIIYSLARSFSLSLCEMCDFHCLKKLYRRVARCCLCIFKQIIWICQWRGYH